MACLDHYPTYTWCQLIGDVTLESFELCLLLGRGNDAGVGRLVVHPGVSPLPRLHDSQHLSLRHGHVDLAQDVVLTPALDKHRESVEAHFAVARSCARLPACNEDTGDDDIPDD